MVQGGSGLGLALETGQRLGIARDFLRKEFQSDKTVEPDVFGLVNHTHSTAAQHLEDAIVRDGLANHRRAESYGQEIAKSIKAEVAVQSDPNGGAYRRFLGPLKKTRAFGMTL
jgi:hypothetical protein